MKPDKRALQILCDTYWRAGGWKRSYETPPDDLAYAKAKGLMFEPVIIKHDELLERIRSVIGKLSPYSVADAFLVSLSSRQLWLRSALGSFAAMRHLKEHARGGNPSRCSFCGVHLAEKSNDLNVLNFERHKFGGVRHTQPLYALFDLEQFLTLPQMEPTDEDLAIFQNFIAAISASPPNTTSSSLEKFLAPHLKSNKNERDNLIGLLGICGVLGTPYHPGFMNAFVPHEDRELPDRHYVDMAYPACWWRSSDGLQLQALDFWFGHRITIPSVP